MINTKDQYQNVDFNLSEPVGVKMEVVKVQISPSVLLDDYCKAFIHEARRKAPLLMEQEEALTSAELMDYSHFLLTQRLKAIRFDCPLWKKLKSLWIPSWIQYVLSCVGEYPNREIGLKFVPELETESTMTFEQARVISDKIFMFKDILQMVLDAMPRGVYGDPDTMSCAIIADYVRATTKVHPTAAVMSAFINAKLVEETLFSALYRQQYDDLDYIRSALISKEDALI